MPDLWMDVDTALSEVPVNLTPLIDDTDFKTVEDALAYNAAGMDLRWNFVTTGGAYTSTAVTPTTGGAYDWAHQGDGMYSIEIPASGGASINNDTEGFGWFTGKATGVLPWRGPLIGFRDAEINNALIDSAWSTTRGLAGTALPAAAADTAGGLPISDAGGVDIDNRMIAAADLTKLSALLAGTPSGSVVDDNDPDPSTTAFETDLAEATNDHYNGAFCVFYSGALAGQSRKISDYDGTSKVLTVATAFTEAPAAGDDFLIIGRSE